jgi:hypothetical protein
MTIGIAGVSVKITSPTRKIDNQAKNELDQIWKADKESKWYPKQVTYWDN